MRKIAVALLLVTPAACSSTADTGDTVAAPSTTPSALAAAVEQVYPGLPPGKADDWAAMVCGYVAEGTHDAAAIDRYVRMRFAGGQRPDPSAEQVAALLGIIKPTC